MYKSSKNTVKRAQFIPVVEVPARVFNYGGINTPIAGDTAGNWLTGHTACYRLEMNRTLVARSNGKYRYAEVYTGRIS